MRPFNLKDIENYEKTLYSDSEAVRERCTGKATVYASLATSSMVCAAIKRFLVNKVATNNIAYSIIGFDMMGKNDKT